jgi:hypothetical protein
MHTKINTPQNDSHFLTQDHWSKTKLGMLHIHLELLWILSYAITKKRSIFQEQILLLIIKL